MKLNIAFFVNSFPSVSETFIVNQIVELVKDGHAIQIFAHTRGTSDTVHQSIKKWGLLNKTVFLDELPGGRVQKIYLLFRNFLKQPARNRRMVARFFTDYKNKKGLSIYQLIPFLERPEFDILHAHFGFNGMYVLSLKKLGIYPKAKFFTSFHGYDLVVTREYYQSLFEVGDAFIVNSDYAAQILIELGCSPGKVSKLPAGLDTRQFEKSNTHAKNKNVLVLLFVGRLIELKGPGLFIRICENLRKNGLVSFKGIIAGDGEMLNELKKQVNESGLDGMVELTGAVTQDEIISMMNNSDVFILPGYRVANTAETQGLVIQEAQSMELPVIVSDAGGMKEGMMDGVTGFVVKEKDIPAFVTKIELLAGDPVLRTLMGQAGRSFVKEHFDSKILNEKLLTIYGL